MPSNLDDIELLTVKDCAEKLDVIPRRVQQFIAEGRLNATKIGGRWFITPEDLDRFAKIPRQPGNLTGKPRVPEN